MLVSEYVSKLEEALNILESLPTEGSSNIKSVLESKYLNSFLLSLVSKAKANLEVITMDMEDLKNDNTEIHVYDYELD